MAGQLKFASQCHIRKFRIYSQTLQHTEPGTEWYAHSIYLLIIKKAIQIVIGNLRIYAKSR